MSKIFFQKSQLIIPLVFFFLSNVVIAQDDDEKPKGPIVVPKLVLDSFQTAYPGITKATWEYGQGDYEVVFAKDGVDMVVDYNVYGHCEEIETEIKINELPQPALDYIHKNYSSFKLAGASKIVTDNFDQAYVAQIGKEGKFWDITFDKKGKFLKEEEAD